jgi:hypothetical protein
MIDLTLEHQCAIGETRDVRLSGLVRFRSFRNRAFASMTGAWRRAARKAEILVCGPPLVD